MVCTGCVGVLMKNSGLLSWLKNSFGGAENMLTGKKLTMKVRALRFAMFELLRDYVGEMKSFQDLVNFLDACSSRKMLPKEWIDNLIISVMLIMVYVRDEREGDFSLYFHG